MQFSGILEILVDKIYYKNLIELFLYIIENHGQILVFLFKGLSNMSLIVGWIDIWYMIEQ